jgi:hypothetical protein
VHDGLAANDEEERFNMAQMKRSVITIALALVLAPSSLRAAEVRVGGTPASNDKESDRVRDSTFLESSYSVGCVSDTARGCSGV